MSANHPILPFLNVLKPDGKLVLVGMPEKPHELPAYPLIMGKAFTTIYSSICDLHTTFFFLHGIICVIFFKLFS